MDQMLKTTVKLFIVLLILLKNAFLTLVISQQTVISMIAKI